MLDDIRSCMSAQTYLFSPYKKLEKVRKYLVKLLCSGYYSEV